MSTNSLKIFLSIFIPLGIFSLFIYDNSNFIRILKNALRKVDGDGTLLLVALLIILGELFLVKLTFSKGVKTAILIIYPIVMVILYLVIIVSLAAKSIGLG